MWELRKKFTKYLYKFKKKKVHTNKYNEYIIQNHTVITNKTNEPQTSYNSLKKYGVVFEEQWLFPAKSYTYVEMNNKANT